MDAYILRYIFSLLFQPLYIRIFSEDSKITGTIFQNGKVMLTGCLSKKYILESRKIILEALKGYIQTKKIKTNQPETLTQNISIWDLI